METGRFSFLFFIIACSGISLTAQNVVESKVDSILYYYNSITHPKDYSAIPPAINYFQTTFDRRIAGGDTLYAIDDLRLIAIGEFKLDFYDESEETAVKALKLIRNYSKKAAISNKKISIYNHLAKVFRSKNDENGALELYEQALSEATTLKQRIVLNNNIGNIYEDIENYPTAKQYFNTAYELVVTTDDPLETARILDNLGSTLDKLSDPKALEYHLQALELYRAANDVTGIKSSYESLANYFRARDRSTARLYADSMLTISTFLGPEDHINAMGLILSLGDYPVGANYHRLSDSLTKARKLAANKYAYQKYNVTLAEQRAQLLELENEKKTREKIGYQIFAGLLILVATLIFFLIRNRNRRLRIKEVYQTESRISKKVHDEVANDLYHVMTKMEMDSTIPEDTIHDLESIYNKTRDISKELAEIDVSKDFDLQLMQLFQDYSSEKTNVITRNLSAINWETITDRKKITLYKVLQELMTNMKKHSRATLVAIVFSESAKKLKIAYRDNGIGGDIKNKNGLRNTENRMEAIGGAISFESEKDKGFKAVITL